MPMYNLQEYCGIYLNIWGRLWQYYRDESSLEATYDNIDFPADNYNSTLFKFKQEITQNQETKLEKILQ